MKCTFAILVGFIALAGVVLVMAAFGTACLMSLRIKRISPGGLLAEAGMGV